MKAQAAAVAGLLVMGGAAVVGVVHAPEGQPEAPVIRGPGAPDGSPAPSRSSPPTPLEDTPPWTLVAPMPPAWPSCPTPAPLPHLGTSPHAAPALALRPALRAMTPGTACDPLPEPALGR